MLIYANIFGFKTSHYVSFITIISKDLTSIWRIKEINFYIDYHSLWYAKVSPIYTNFLVVDFFITWIMLFIDKRISSTESLKDDEGKILQKKMNKKMTNY